MWVNCASSTLVLAWLFEEIEKTRTKSKLDKAISIVKGLYKHTLVYAMAHNGLIINCGLAGGVLNVNCHGFVTNFQELVAAEVHRSIVAAMGLQWQSMMEAGDANPHPLLSDWSTSQLALLDVTMFCLLAPRTRRLQQKKPWTGASKALLTKLLHVMVFFFADIVTDFVKCYKVQHNVYDKRLPSRTLKGRTTRVQ